MLKEGERVRPQEDDDDKVEHLRYCHAISKVPLKLPYSVSSPDVPAMSNTVA